MRAAITMPVAVQVAGDMPPSQDQEEASIPQFLQEANESPLITVIVGAAAPTITLLNRSFSRSFRNAALL